MMRIRQIDALRAIAVLLVLGCHLRCYPILIRFGWTGVDLFYVLSGFLISGLLFIQRLGSGTWRGSFAGLSLLARENSFKRIEHTALRLAAEECRIVLQSQCQNHLPRQHRILQES